MIEERVVVSIRATLALAGLEWTEAEIERLAKEVGNGGHKHPSEPSGTDMDVLWMRRAIDVARRHQRMGDRPFGCVIVDADGKEIAYAGGSERTHDPTWHSEMEAIRRACARTGGLLHGCTIYSTHEPCTMCCGAICHAKLSRVVIGSQRRHLPDLFRQRTTSMIALLDDTSAPPDIQGGICSEECIALFDQERAR